MLKNLFLTLALSAPVFAEVESLDTRVNRLLAANQQKEAEDVVKKEIELSERINKKRAERHETTCSTADLHALLSRVYADAGKTDLALHEIGIARNEEPDILLFQEQEAQCYFDAGLYASCIDAAAKLEQKTPEDRRRWARNLGAHAHKRLADAQFLNRLMPNQTPLPWHVIIEHYNNALECPDFAFDDSAYANRGMLLFETNQNEKALKDFEKALTLNPQYTPHYENFLYSLQRANRLGDLVGEVQKIRGVNNDIFYDAASGAIQALCLATKNQPSLPEEKGRLLVTLQPDRGTIDLFVKLSEYHQKNWLDYVKTFGKEEAEQETGWRLAVRYAHIAGMLSAAKSLSEGNSGADSITTFLNTTVPLYQPIASVIQLGPVVVVDSLNEYHFKNKEIVMELLNPQHLLEANKAVLNK